MSDTSVAGRRDHVKSRLPKSPVSLSEGKDDSFPEAPFTDVPRVSLVTSESQALSWLSHGMAVIG